MVQLFIHFAQNNITTEHHANEGRRAESYQKQNANSICLFELQLQEREEGAEPGLFFPLPFLLRSVRERDKKKKGTE